MDSLTQLNIEKLKKEVWVINKKKIPALQEQINLIANADMGNIIDRLNAQQSALNSLSNSLDLLATKQETNAEKILSLENKTTNQDESIASITASITEINQTLSSLSTLLSSHTQQISSLNSKTTANENSIEQIQGTLTSHTETLDSHDKSISSHEEDISSIQDTLSSYETILTSHTGMLASHAQTLTTHSNSISSLQSSSSSHEETLATHTQQISSIQTQLETLSTSIAQNTTNISNLSNSLNDLTQRVDDLEDYPGLFNDSIADINSQISNLQSQQNTTTSTANSALALAQEVEEKVENLTLAGGTTSEGGTDLGGDVLFDSRSTDETLNLGFSTGAKYQEHVEIDYSNYHYLRIFLLFGGSNEQQVLVDVENKKGFVYSVLAWTGTKYVSAIRLRLPTTRDYVSIDSLCRFIFDGESVPAYESTTSLQNSFYIYRIEGVDKLR